MWGGALLSDGPDSASGGGEGTLGVWRGAIFPHRCGSAWSGWGQRLGRRFSMSTAAAAALGQWSLWRCCFPFSSSFSEMTVPVGKSRAQLSTAKSNANGLASTALADKGPLAISGG